MKDTSQEIWSTIKRNKLRTMLTGLAVSWGIFMLIVLLGAGNGVVNAFLSASDDVAVNTAVVYGGYTSMPHKGNVKGRYIRLQLEDAKAFDKRFSNQISGISPSFSAGYIRLVNGIEYVNTSLNGVFPIYQEVKGIKLITGRFINELDISQRRKVIVIHKATAETLFSFSSQALGQYLKADGTMYRIVGIYNDNRDNNNSSAYVPMTTLSTIYQAGGKVGDISLKLNGLTTQKENEAFEKKMRQLLAARHDFNPNDERAVWIWNRLMQNLQQKEAVKILNTALWVIGLCTLMSGVVGISNIMLITVKERTHEFGIRKALGAKPFSILRLVLLESIVITTFFGYLGMLAGIVVTEYMNIQAGNSSVEFAGQTLQVFKDPTVDMFVAFQATLTLIVAGTLAGFLPARKAVMIKPIEALRAD